MFTHLFLYVFWGGADLNLLRDEVRLYSCTPRNFSVSLREELKRTDVIFWPSCLLVNRCGGNCACCSHRCYDCQCLPTRVTKKYHEVNASTSLEDDVSVLPALLKDFEMRGWNLHNFAVAITQYYNSRHCEMYKYLSELENWDLRAKSTYTAIFVLIQTKSTNQRPS